MKLFAGLITLLIVAFTSAIQPQTTVGNINPYPNELPTLKLYRDAKWNSLRPYVSTEGEIHRVLGKPVPFYDELLRTEVAGYDGGFDWTIVVGIVGKGGNLPNTVVDRLDHLTLYPKRRVSLIGADFSAFSITGFYNSNAKTTLYSDKFGLRYVLYAEDAADGRFHIGDLKLIEYCAPDAETDKLTGKPNSDAEQIVGPERRLRTLHHHWSGAA
jgi:hypothetical protein